MNLSAAEAAQLFRAPPDRFIEAAVGEVAYRRVGEGPDVLFVHGWPVSSATFRTLLPFLAEHVTCHLIDLPGAGSSRFSATTPVSIANHIVSVRRVLDALALDEVAVVGHDSGGLIARHALAGDPRLRALTLIDTEQSTGMHWRFRSFIAARRVPGFGAALGWIAGQPALRRNGFVLGDAFADRSLLDGEFDEFFLRPLRTSRTYRDATVRLLRSFDLDLVRELDAVHRRIDVPVRLVWGEHDKFFPVEQAKQMVSSFPDATLSVIEGAGLFSHEERPAEVAAALLPSLGASGGTRTLTP
ncbi:MAG TPA: alpha/beta hydrolase [Acidimicrobiia bacterium]|nr:alpha/beta hydrolase [Acidimicrobiia bacterium]